MDKEIEAMSAISKALESLGDDARARVLSWAQSRYFTTTHVEKTSSAKPGPVAHEAESVSEAPAEDDREFEHLADLFSAVDPGTNAEKVLVAAYWHQKILGESVLTSAALNKDLADLGHRVVNISQRFDNLIESKPALALQLKKSGSSKQARKQYKLTQAGLRKIDEILEGRTKSDNG